MEKVTVHQRVASAGIVITVAYLMALMQCSPNEADRNFTLTAVNTVNESSIPLTITTSLSASHSSVGNYGIRPSIAVVANRDNSFDVALYASQSKQIQLISFDPNGNKTGELTPAAISGARGLLGLTRITEDNSFAIAWSKDNASGDEAFEYWITRIDKSGTVLYSTRIFGDSSSALVNSEGEPGDASTGRLAYNALTKKICFYCGHSRKWPDGVRHQGGHIGFIDLQGNFVVADSWYFSHNFDQRLIVVDSCYYTLAHGDAYPRALGFAKWDDLGSHGHRLAESQYFSIPGATGDNTTNTQTGGLISLQDGTFGVIFSTSIGRGGFDLCYKRLDGAGNELASSWLTSYNDSRFALYPRIAPYGENILILWEEIKDRSPLVRSVVIDYRGQMLTPFGTLDSVRLSPFYDLTALPNGDVIWVAPKTSQSLSLCRIRGQ